MSERKLSIVAVGAHMDDCWLGMGATAIKAARHGHQVTMIQAVSTYGSWPAVTGRAAEVHELTNRVARQHNIQLMTLGYDYMRVENNPATISRIAAAMAELQPDVVFCHWEDDSNQDHAALGAASRIAAIHSSCFRPAEEAPNLKWTREIHQFEIDLQTRNFDPNVFIDVTDELYDALEVAAMFDDLYARAPIGAGPNRRLDVIDRAKDARRVSLVPYTEEKLAHGILYGCRSGCRYAEGFRSYKHDSISKSVLATL